MTNLGTREEAIGAMETQEDNDDDDEEEEEKRRFVFLVHRRELSIFYLVPRLL